VATAGRLISTLYGKIGHVLMLFKILKINLFSVFVRCNDH